MSFLLFICVYKLGLQPICLLKGYRWRCWSRSPVAEEGLRVFLDIGTTPGRNHGRAIERRRVLQAGHAARILVEGVEKATDNRPARSLCYPKVADAMIPRCDRPVVGPSAFPHGPPRAGANDYFDERPGPVLRDLGNGTGDSTRPPSPQEASRRGPESRAALIPCRTAREGNNGGPIRHSIGRKVAGDPILRECCRADTPLASLRSVSSAA